MAKQLCCSRERREFSAERSALSLPRPSPNGRGRKKRIPMKPIQSDTATQPGSPADHRFLFHGLTLIALGLSVLFLNSWDSLFVRTAIGLFWGAFFLISNWSDLVQALRSLNHTNGLRRRSTERSSVQR